MKGIIFDFNGTLFWDSEIQENAWKTFGKKLSGRDITDEEFNTYFHERKVCPYVFCRYIRIP